MPRQIIISPTLEVASLPQTLQHEKQQPQPPVHDEQEEWGCSSTTDSAPSLSSVSYLSTGSSEDSDNVAAMDVDLHDNEDYVDSKKVRS